MIPFFRKRTSPASSGRGASWRRLLLPGLTLGLLLTIVPIVAAVRADHDGQATVLTTVTPSGSGPGNLAVTLSAPLIVPQGAPFTATATLTNSGSITIENAGVTIQPPVGITLSGNAAIYVSDIGPGGSQEATWLLTADSDAAIGDYIILASAHGNEVGYPAYTLIAEDTVTVGVVLPAASNDGDGIAAEVDTLPAQFSNDFSDVDPFGNSDGTTTGTITARGGQVLSVTDEPYPKGVLILADPSGSGADATVVACGGITSLALSAGDWVVLTCSSAIIQVLEGTVEVSFFGADGELATSSLNAGNGLTFKPESVSVRAALDNLVPVTVLIEVNGVQREFALVPGATIGLIKGLAARLINVKIKSNGINPKSNRPVPVAILGDSAFDVIDVDAVTLRLGPDRARPVSAPRFEDTDNDGHIDLVVNFHARDSGLNLAAVSLCLFGNTVGGVEIAGCGIVTVIAEIIPVIPPTLVAESQPEEDAEEDNSESELEAAAVPPPTNKAPKADAQELETASGTPLVITLTGSDKETCDLDFTIVDGPANGALSVVSDAGCVAGPPTNTDSATLTYTPNDGFSGEDSFTFLVNDGAQDSEPAAVSITVED